MSDAIKTAYAGLGNISVAVRSSATAEDLPDASLQVSRKLILTYKVKIKLLTL